MKGYPIIAYATVGANDLETMLPFYTALLTMAGLGILFEADRGGIIFGKDGRPVLGVVRPHDMQPATQGNGTMIALELQDRAAVDAFHATALALGASNEGSPGERGPGYYMSYFRDPEGNKFAACKLG